MKLYRINESDIASHVYFPTVVVLSDKTMKMPIFASQLPEFVPSIVPSENDAVILTEEEIPEENVIPNPIVISGINITAYAVRENT